MNRFPIWKGKRIGRYDDRLILRSVIFFCPDHYSIISIYDPADRREYPAQGIPSLPDCSFMSAGSALSMEKRSHGGYPELSGNVADAAGKPMV